jgi:hypothetical protein
LCVSYFDIQILFSVQSLPRPSYFCAQFCPTMATIFCSSWDECLTTLWTVPAFSEPANDSWRPHPPCRCGSNYSS